MPCLPRGVWSSEEQTLSRFRLRHKLPSSHSSLELRPHGLSTTDKVPSQSPKGWERTQVVIMQLFVRSQLGTSPGKVPTYVKRSRASSLRMWVWRRNAGCVCGSDSRVLVIVHLVCLQSRVEVQCFIRTWTGPQSLPGPPARSSVTTKSSRASLDGILYVSLLGPNELALSKQLPDRLRYLTLLMVTPK